ncbi:MAG: hypothetical protein U9Q40_03130 [Campylobacterota bacterium]|nr:hypothetical protein [Campylobacterota bacterium]
MANNEEVKKLIDTWVNKKREEYDGMAYPLGYLMSLLENLAVKDDELLKKLQFHFGEKL